MPKTKTLIKITGYAISILFLYITFHKTNFSIIIQNLKYINIIYILFAFLLTIVFFIIRGIYQINNLKYLSSEISLFQSITSVASAQFYNSIFPARFGDILRAFYLTKNKVITKSTVLSYIFIEKVLDLFIIFILLIMIVLLKISDPNLTQYILIFSGLFFVLGIGLLLYVRQNKFIFGKILLITPLLIHDLLKQINTNIVLGLTCFRSVNQTIKSIILLLLSWLIIAGIFWLFSYPYLYRLHLPYYAFLVLMVFSALSLSIPSAPSGIGVVHYGLFFAIKVMNGSIIDTDINLVAAFVVTLHFLTVLMDISVGGLFILINKMYLSNKGQSR